MDKFVACERIELAGRATAAGRQVSFPNDKLGYQIGALKRDRNGNAAIHRVAHEHTRCALEMINHCPNATGMSFKRVRKRHRMIAASRTQAINHNGGRFPHRRV